MNRPNLFLASVVLACATFLSCHTVSGDDFRRGDYLRDGSVNVGDVIEILEYMAQLAAPGSCLDAADVNDDGAINIGDPVYLLYYMFVPGSPPPPEPQSCGADPTPDSIDCASYALCP